VADGGSLPPLASELAATHTPFSQRRSAGNDALATTVVMAFRSSWFIVTETLHG
jgi:hypothetical protein